MSLFFENEFTNIHAISEEKAKRNDYSDIIRVDEVIQELKQLE
jgi:hypothetical protein